jgi:hypothetical protein
MPCKTCGHDSEHCDSCRCVSGSSSRSEEHNKHVANCLIFTPEQREDFWKQLQNAVNHRIGEDQIKWNVFSLFAAANAALVITLLSSDPLPRSGVSFAVSSVGLVLGIVWFSIQKRALQYMRFFETVQCKLETNLAIDPALSLTRLRSSDPNRSLGKPGERSRYVMMIFIGLVLIAWFFSSTYFFIRCFACTGFGL